MREGHLPAERVPHRQRECWIDGRFLGAFPVVESQRPATVALMLAGRTHKTRLYHGPVLVTRGLRY